MRRLISSGTPGSWNQRTAVPEVSDAKESPEKAAICRPGRPVVLSTPEMPASVYSTIESIGARAVIAGRDYAWEIAVAKHAGRNARHGAPWSYRSSGLELKALPPSRLPGSIQYRNAAAAIAALEALALRPLDMATVSAGRWGRGRWDAGRCCGSRSPGPRW